MKKRWKQWFAIVFAAVMLFSACGGNPGTSAPAPGTGSSTGSSAKEALKILVLIPAPGGT